LPTLKELGLRFSSIDSRAAIQFKGGETEAMKRMNHYFLNQKLII
jgi:deoxyribodipyrimidine photo-lyase